MRLFQWCLVLGTLLVGAGGCGGGDPDGAPDEPGEAGEPTPQATPTGGLWVTFDVNGEKFKAQITQSESIDYVLGYLDGEQPKRIPNGIVQRGGKFNSRWSWSFEPGSVEFADVTMQLCDATPSHVEQHLNQWIEEVGRYCPWSATIVGAEDCRSGDCALIN